jgi:hypothetical protein
MGKYGGNDLKESDRGLIEVLSSICLGELEGNRKKVQSG